MNKQPPSISYSLLFLKIFSKNKISFSNFSFFSPFFALNYLPYCSPFDLALYLSIRYGL